MRSNSERSQNIDWNRLGLYMTDHVAGATAGIERITRMAKAYRDTEHADVLATMSQEFREEREVYYDLMERYELPRRAYRQAIAWAAEKAGRFKLNGAIIGTSPSTPVLETELLRAAVLAKIGGWQSLAVYREDLDIPPEKLPQLIDQAGQQIDQLSAMHESFRATAFRPKKAT